MLCCQCGEGNSACHEKNIQCVSLEERARYNKNGRDEENDLHKQVRSVLAVERVPQTDCILHKRILVRAQREAEIEQDAIDNKHEHRARIGRDLEEEQTRKAHIEHGRADYRGEQTGQEAIEENLRLAADRVMLDMAAAVGESEILCILNGDTERSCDKMLKESLYLCAGKGEHLSDEIDNS